MKSTVKERLEFFLKSKKISNSEFGRRVGACASYVASIRKSISPDKIEGIAENWPDLNIEWLLTGEGEMLKTQSTHTVVTGDVSGNGNQIVAGNNMVLHDQNVDYIAEPKAEDTETIETLEAIPIVSPEQAKKPNYDLKALVKQGSPDIERISIGEFFGRFGDFDAVIPTYRDSMMPMYMPGDFLFIKYRQVTNDSYIKQGKYLVDTRAHGSILCFAEDMEDGTLELTFKNARKYKPMRLAKEEIMSIADIVLMVRMGDMAFEVMDVGYLQQQLDAKDAQLKAKDDQFASLAKQFDKTGDRVNRVIDQNQQLINTLIDVIKKEK